VLNSRAIFARAWRAVIGSTAPLTEAIMSQDGTSRDDRYQALTFYIVADVSWSMEESGAIIAANALLSEVHEAVMAEPVIADVVKLGIIDFSDDARVLLRLGDLRDVTTIPQLRARGGTSFAAAFRLVRQEIERDVPALKADNYRVFRPAVFFITDGQPTDDAGTLQAAFAELTAKDFDFRPNVIPFGVGDATKTSMDLWVFPNTGEKKMRSYVARDGADPAKAITEMAHLLISSILASAGSVNDPSTTATFVLPEDEDGDWL
jgi:uncharacterized protein YegL